MLAVAVARGSHSCAAEIDLGTTTPRKKPGPENLGSGDDTRELHKTRVFHQIFNAADGPEKSGFRACLTATPGRCRGGLSSPACRARRTTAGGPHRIPALLCPFGYIIQVIESIPDWSTSIHVHRFGPLWLDSFCLIPPRELYINALCFV